MLTLRQAGFHQSIGIAFPHPVQETILGWDKYDDNVSFLPKDEQEKINMLADMIVSSFTQTELPPFRHVQIIGHADKDWQGPEWEASVSKNRAVAVDEYLKSKVPRLWKDNNMGPIPAGGIAHVEVSWWGSTHLIAPPFHRRNRRVDVILERTGAPIAVDTLLMKITRWLVLLDKRNVTLDPNAYYKIDAAKTTGLAKCLLQKLRPDPSSPNAPNPNAVEVIIDGILGQQEIPTINGYTPKYYDCYPIYGRAVGWKGNYDGSSAHVQPAKGSPMSDSEFQKFLKTVSPMLKGEGFDADKSDDQILAGLGAIIQMIHDGINLVDAYIQISGMVQQSDIFIKAILRTDGFVGDNARSKLRNLYVHGINDDTNIYSCWK